ncbi:hypothetical protein GCM10010145_64800 [Streptomyces ruber]|uniref:Large ribosomal subunit protein bL32 n=3 Tax=Streptomyces TaxID=1883 RepID=A0A918EXG0_9ACTN|nr:hypothetical protein GCM10010145_64800 [Streptomyces ruber]
MPPAAADPFHPHFGEDRLMAVPKRKMSRSNTRHRRAQWKASAPKLVTVTIEGVSHRVPQHLVPAYRRGLLRPED